MKPPKVFKRAGSPFYWYRLFSGGRETWHSTEQKTKDAAEAIATDARKAQKGAGEVEQYFNMLVARLAALPVGEQAEIRQRYARRLMMRTGSTVATTHAWQAWLDSPQKGNPGERTCKGYSAIWHRFKKWADKKQIHGLHEISTSHAEEYAADLWRDKVAPSTFNAHVGFLRAMFSTLQDRAGILDDPFAKLKTMEKHTRGRLNFTADELAKICKMAKGSFRYMIAIGLYTGARLSDVINLRWQDIHTDRIQLVPQKTSRRGKSVVLPIHPTLAALLAERRVQMKGEYVFPDEREAHAKDTSVIAKRFRDFLQTCGITTTEALTETTQRQHAAVIKGFHSLRHSFVSLCAMNNVPQVAIQDLVGHGSPAMTALYSHANFDQKRTAIAALPDTFAPQKRAKKERSPMPAVEVQHS